MAWHTVYGGLAHSLNQHCTCPQPGQESNFVADQNFNPIQWQARIRKDRSATSLTTPLFYQRISTVFGLTLVKTAFGKFLVLQLLRYLKTDFQVQLRQLRTREVPVRSFFTSSLDKISPPSPYIRAMDWDSYRAQFRTHPNGKSGNRNSVLALGSLNPDSAGMSCSFSSALDIPLIVQNTSKTRFVVENHAESEALAALAVDACFGAANIAFLDENVVVVKEIEREGSDWLSDGSFDMELGLLESVQEIALALCRTTPKRTVSSNSNLLGNAS